MQLLPRPKSETRSSKSPSVGEPVGVSKGRSQISAPGPTCIVNVAYPVVTASPSGGENHSSSSSWMLHGCREEAMASAGGVAVESRDLPVVVDVCRDSTARRARWIHCHETG